MANKPAELLLDHIGLLKSLERSLPVLDLACGNGRNGLVLAPLGILVEFADKSSESLTVVRRRLAKGNLPGKVWQVDLEQHEDRVFSGKHYSAILGFCYLHRPLFPGLKEALMPGGLVIYETFTDEQQRFGRPDNPDFLLRPGELKTLFENWEIVHYFEGTLENPDRAIAQIIARKP